MIWETKTEQPRGLIREHIDRCNELYGAPIDVEFNEAPSREGYEQMRADMMILLGIVMAKVE